MTKITFIGAGSTAFVRNTIGDCMCREALRDSHIALYDIDPVRTNLLYRARRTIKAGVLQN